MGRRIRTLVPQTDEFLLPQWSYVYQFRRQNKMQKDLQKKYFDSHHRASNLPVIPDNTEVWITTEGGPVEGTVVSQADRPRSYVVATPLGKVERNRQHLRVVPQTEKGQETEKDTQASPIKSPTPRIMTRSRTAIALQPAERPAPTSGVMTRLQIARQQDPNIP